MMDTSMDALPAIGSTDGPAACLALAVVYRQAVCSPPPLAPPAGMRPPPPADEKRALASSSIPQISEHTVAPDPARGVVAKKGKREPRHPPLLGADADERIDQTDWRQRARCWNRRGLILSR